jgi:hypothetical protein
MVSRGTNLGRLLKKKRGQLSAVWRANPESLAKVGNWGKPCSANPNGYCEGLPERGLRKLKSDFRIQK